MFANSVHFNETNHAGGFWEENRSYYEMTVRQSIYLNLGIHYYSKYVSNTHVMLFYGTIFGFCKFNYWIAVSN